MALPSSSAASLRWGRMPPSNTRSALSAPHHMSTSLPASQLRAPESIQYSALKCNDFMLGAT